jgi:hypothetical protein
VAREQQFLASGRIKSVQIQCVLGCAVGYAAPATISYLRLMKRLIGLVLLLLALAGLVSTFRHLANDPAPQPTGNSAYDAGRKVGRYTAPVVLVVLGIIGLGLLLQSDHSAPAEARPGLYRMWAAPGAPPAPGQPPPLPRAGAGKPWFSTTPAIIAFCLAGGLVMLVLLSGLVVGLVHPTRHGPTAPFTPPTRPPTAGRPWQSSPTQTGPYAVGGGVEANWAGKWIPGKITRVNPGGYSVMVQLDDPRFRMPIVLSTNQIRPK